MTTPLALLLALVFALQWLDGLTTRRVLAHGGREKNPIMRWAFARVGFWPAIAIKSVAVTLVGWIGGHYVSLWLPTTICLAFTAACIWNWRLVR